MAHQQCAQNILALGNFVGHYPLIRAATYIRTREIR